MQLLLLKRTIILVPVIFLVSLLQIQAQTEVPDDQRGTQDAVARGEMNGNLIETNYRNFGEMSRFDDIPFGVYPRGAGLNRHIDGIGLYVSGRVQAVNFNTGEQTFVTPTSQNYRDWPATGPDGNIWGWLPLPGFLNQDRINQRGDLERIPARSDDPSSWPEFWPDRLNVADDPGWPGQWNGLFGKGVFNADLESYYAMDDFSDKEYTLDPESGEPFNENGNVYFPDPADSTKGGLGLRVFVRLLQWNNILTEDIMFLLYEIQNTNTVPHDQLFFTQINDYGMGNEEGDEVAEFDPQQDVVFGWDLDGIGNRATGGTFPLAFTGFALLDTPANGNDGLDNDEDGIVDEKRNSGPGILIEGQDAILAEANNRIDVEKFEEFNFRGSEPIQGPIRDSRAYQAGRWWTGDENLDWVGFSDDNENGQWDPGEFLNDDLGEDGLGQFDLNYPGPDRGEGNGIPDVGEPNFDRLDIDESDQLGLRGFDLNSRQFYQGGPGSDNLYNDVFLWTQFMRSIFPLGTEPGAQEVDGIEPFLTLISGPVEIQPEVSDFFSTAWVFGLGPDNNASRQDFFKNLRAANTIFRADYQFAQPPIEPKLTAKPEEGRVILSWDTLSTISFDRFLQEFDFEGYKVYRGTDNLLSDSKIITDNNGIPVFNRPIAQFDLDNDISGTIPVLENTAIYDLGDNTGLEFFHIDEDVTNGIRYYYVVVAYDRGSPPDVDPQENTFRFEIDASANILNSTQNAQAVVPRTKPAGFVDAGSQGLDQLSTGIGTGSASIVIANENEANFDSTLYEIEFSSEPVELNEDGIRGRDLYQTTGYTVRNTSDNTTLFTGSDLSNSSPLIDGFLLSFDNKSTIERNDERTGYVGSNGFSNDPTEIEGLETNWTISISQEDSLNGGTLSPFDFELRWIDSTYLPPRFLLGTALREEINVRAIDVTNNELRDLFILDQNDSGEFDVGDDLIIAENTGRRSFDLYHRVRFRLPPGAEESVAPSTGDRIRISMERPFRQGDEFMFTLQQSDIDENLASDELDDIRVVPNPYVGASSFERRQITFGRGERRVRFVNLPQQCTIKIFNLRGEMVRKLEHNGVGNDGGLFWDLRTSENRAVAYGVYVFHVNAPGIGEKTGKFALIK